MQELSKEVQNTNNDDEAFNSTEAINTAFAQSFFVSNSSENEYDDDEIEEEDDFNDFEYENCDCLPSCSSIDYDVQISQSPIDIQKHLKAHNDFYDPDDE